MIDQSILQSCNPGSTGYAQCVTNKTGKYVANWAPHSTHQNDAIAAHDDAKRYAMFLKMAPHLLAEPEDYFKHIPVAVMIEMAASANLAKSVSDQFRKLGVKMPAVLSQYFVD